MTQSLDYLRTKHRKFLYHSYQYNLEKGDLHFDFHFEIDPGIHFTPNVVVKGVDETRVLNIEPKVLNNLAFHLGLMEIPSYWKATCSPEIIVEAGSLNPEQLGWWLDLLLKGQGEFFYLNNVDFTIRDFVTIKASALNAPATCPFDEKLDKERVLVPMGGGKDSAVTLELLAHGGKDVTPWSLNPIAATTEIIKISNTPKPIFAYRTIDAELLKLNSEGYLNGHTPFSAYLAFLSTVTAALFDFRTIALSNERSSNEGNVEFRGAVVNHQYSKSFDFETRFRWYSKTYLAADVDYFSFLRPLYEIQIAKIFSQLPKYFSAFRSCNKGQKTGVWCHSCPKCLFTFSILYPFVDDDELYSIFSEDLFSKEELIGTAFSLLGRTAAKPFECIGAKEETLVAFYLCLKKARQTGKAIPIVLHTLADQVYAQLPNMEDRVSNLLNAWNDEHALNDAYEVLLRKGLDSCRC